MTWALLAICNVGAETGGGRCLRLLSSTNQERKVVKKLSLLRVLPSFPLEGESSIDAVVDVMEVRLSSVPCDVDVGRIGGDGALRGAAVVAS